MESLLTAAFVLSLDTVETTVKNREPFLNIEETSGCFYYRLIIIMKTMFVLYSIDNHIPKSLTFTCMAIGKIYVTSMEPMMELVSCIGMISNMCELFHLQMTIMGMVAINYKSYEFLLDVFVLLCLLYYAVKTYERELNNLIRLFFLLLCIWTYVSTATNMELFEEVLGYVGLVFCMLIFLSPNNLKYRLRLIFLYIVMCAWIFYKSDLHFNNEKLLALQTRNTNDVCMIVNNRYEIEKCGLNEAAENKNEFLINSFDLSNRIDYDTVQDVNLPLKSPKEVEMEKLFPTNTLRDYKLGSDAILYTNTDGRVKDSGIEKLTTGRKTNEYTVKTSTEIDEKQISTFGIETKIIDKDYINYINLADKPYIEDIDRRGENQFQCENYSAGNFTLTETAADKNDQGDTSERSTATETSSDDVIYKRPENEESTVTGMNFELIAPEFSETFDKYMQQGIRTEEFKLSSQTTESNKCEEMLFGVLASDLQSKVVRPTKASYKESYTKSTKAIDARSSEYEPTTYRKNKIETKANEATESLKGKTANV